MAMEKFAQDLRITINPEHFILPLHRLYERKRVHVSNEVADGYEFSLEDFIFYELLRFAGYSSIVELQDRDVGKRIFVYQITEKGRKMYEEMMKESEKCEETMKHSNFKQILERELKKSSSF